MDLHSDPSAYGNIGRYDTQGKKAFLICPVRGISDSMKARFDAQVKHLEDVDGWTIHYPPRDTNQHTDSLKTCELNKQAIKDADMVFIIWDGKSKGCMFDLGMAFVLNKSVQPIVGYFPKATVGYKSFQNMVYQYAG